MANEFVNIVDSGSYDYEAQFKLPNGDIYAIRYETTGDGYQEPDPDTDPDAYQLGLVKLEQEGSGNWKSSGFAELSDGRLVVMGLLPARVDMFYEGDVIKAIEAFVVSINEFLQEAGMTTDDTFPVDGTTTEIVEWLAKAIKNIGGKAILVRQDV